MRCIGLTISLAFFAFFANGQTIKLTQLEKGQTVESSKSGQIGLTNTDGVQRYAQYLEVEPTPIGYTPASSGNTLNLSEFVIDPAGRQWFIDWQGRATSFSTGTLTSLGYVAPAAGLTISGTNPATTTATWTYALANDLAALEALSSTGIPARTTTDTWALRTITAGTGISVADGDGVAGNPTITNTGVITEVDGSVTNEAWTVDADDADTELITTQTVKFQGSGIVVTDYIPGTDILTITGTEVDGSTTNEIQTYGHAGTTTYTNTLSGGGGLWSITGAGIAAISQTGGAITVTATEADGSTTNELQTIANTSDATSHTVTLSNSGGSVQLVEGAGVTFTTTGTSGDGIVTIAASGGSGTVTNFSAGDLSPLFTTSEATTTTTPALTFSLSNAAANTYFGNATTGTAAPAHTAAAALTDVDDTNVTLSVGGNAATSLLRSASITAGWTGTLAVSRGGIGVGTITGLMQGNGTSAVTGITNSSTTGQVLRVTGASTYAWGALDLANSSAVTGDLPSANISQGVARSVWGVTGNATADHADIQGTTDQVLRVTTAGTALGFGTVATGGITNDAVTYAKLQNVAANNVVLGNISGTNQNAAELTVSNLYTLLGLSGTAGRNAYWSGTNTLSNSANWLWDNTNGRVTIIPQVAGLGAGTAALNIMPPGSGTLTSMEAIRSWGNINGNILSGLYNTNTGASSNAIETISSGSNAAGDPILQFLIAGTGGSYASMGLDNSDANKFKLATTATYPGNFNNSSFVITQDAIPLYGFNTDAPAYTVDVSGTARALRYIGVNAQWNSGHISFGTGAGTGPTLVSISGPVNAFTIAFTTGTSPTTNATILNATYPIAFPLVAVPVFSARSGTTSTEIAKFYFSANNANGFTLQAQGTLTASTTYYLTFFIFGS